MRSLRNLAGLAILLVGCGDDRSAGNNGTSTDNVVTARFSVDSIALDLVRPDTGAYPLLVRLDSGDLDYAKTLYGGADLNLSFDNGVSVPFAVREWDRSENQGSLWARVPRSQLGRHRILRVSYGDLVFRNLSNPVATWSGVSQTLRNRLTSVVLADFEQDTLRALLPCNCNNWYTGIAPGSTLLLPAAGKPIESAIVADPLGRRTWVLHIAYTAGANTGGVNNWALAGTRLGTRFHRMGMLDSITLRARGKGVLRVALEDGRDSLGFTKAWAPVMLDSSWKRVVIRPSDFDPPDQWNTGWQSVKDRINTFSVFGQQGTDFWVDDIVFHGVGPQDLP